MGTLGGGNGERPHDGQPEGLSGLPPEWGIIVVPDDPAELATEADEIRRELRHEARQRRWRRRLGLPGTLDPDQPSIGLPLLIMTIAIVATLTSLFAATWPRQQHSPPAAKGRPVATPVPDVTLIDGAGQAVELRSVVPAVVVLVDGCACARLVADVAASARPGVAVLPVDSAVPETSGTAPAGPVRPLADPNGELRRALGLPTPSGTASVALFARGGELVKLVPSVHAVDEFRTELAALGA